MTHNHVAWYSSAHTMNWLFSHTYSRVNVWAQSCYKHFQISLQFFQKSRQNLLLIRLNDLGL